MFCPFMMMFSLKVSLLLMIIITAVMMIIINQFFTKMMPQLKTDFVYMMFPDTQMFAILLLSGFFLLAGLNLLSMTLYSYPVTTTLSFNLSLAMTLWLASVLLMLMKVKNLSFLLPLNSPWYLMSFLVLVELVSTGVRPITLCFRLLANLSAGHILLALICKMMSPLWLLGSLFGILELMVSVVQAFVFLMLVSVYLQESFTH